MHYVFKVTTTILLDHKQEKHKTRTVGLNWPQEENNAWKTEIISRFIFVINNVLIVLKSSEPASRKFCPPGLYANSYRGYTPPISLRVRLLAMGRLYSNVTKIDLATFVDQKFRANWASSTL